MTRREARCRLTEGRDLPEGRRHLSETEKGARRWCERAGPKREGVTEGVARSVLDAADRVLNQRPTNRVYTIPGIRPST